jgi:hypothetical protein
MLLREAAEFLANPATAVSLLIEIRLRAAVLHFE